MNSLDEYNKIRHLIKQIDIDINKICTKKRMVRGKCGTIEDKKIFINEGLKNANDYSLPLMILDVDKKINNSKHKLFAEKRNEEENKTKINEFGLIRAKYKTNLINKYELKDLINKYTKNNNMNSILLNKNIMNTTRYKNIDEEENENKSFSFNNIISNDNINVNSNAQKNFEKSKSERTVNYSKIFYNSIDKKVKINSIRNLNKETNKIIDQQKEKIIFNEIILKDSIKKESNEQLLNKCLKDTIIPSDSIPTLLYRDKILRHKIIYRNILNIPIKNEKSRQVDSSLEKSTSLEEKKLLYKNTFNINYNISAYNSRNLETMQDLKYFCKSMKSIRSKNISQEVKINNKFDDSFHLNKDNYLSIRKSISDIRKKEFKDFLNYRIRNRKRNIIQSYHSYHKNNFELSRNKRESTKLLSNNLFIAKDNSIKMLTTAILNPNESNIFSKYYLPRSGSMLLSKIENRKK